MPGPSRRKLLVFDTHPIQYRSPVFRALYAKHPDTEVVFFNEAFDGTRWWFHEVGKIPKQVWELPLREGFPNRVIGTRELGLRRTHRELARLIDADPPAAVVVYGYYLPEHWLLRRLCAVRSIPLVFVGETFSSGGSLLRRLVKRPLQRYFFRGISQFVTIGNRTETFYRKLGVSGARITRAKYCVDVGFFTMPEKEAEAARARLRAELGIPRDAFVMLFVGRLFERKRPWDVLSIFESLRAHDALHAVIVGNGPLEARLREQAKGDPRVHFAGFRNQAATRDAYYASDLLLVPSEYETWGLVVNEAFACGLPALVTDACGVAGDLVLPGETGFTFPVGKPDVAAELVARFLRDRSLRDRVGARARDKVRREYSVEQFADAFLEALARVSGSVVPVSPRTAAGA